MIFIEYIDVYIYISCIVEQNILFSLKVTTLELVFINSNIFRPHNPLRAPTTLTPKSGVVTSQPPGLTPMDERSSWMHF